MRWVRIKILLLAFVLSAYFAIAHSAVNGFLTAFFIVLMIIVVFGSAFLDRILYDPSAVFIEKPWRLMRPSIGDFFRLYLCLLVAGLTLPIIFLRGSFFSEAALSEIGLIAFGISLYEFSRLYVERVRWNGTTLDVRSKFGHRVKLHWSDIREVRMARFSNYAVFVDRAGRRVKVSKRLRGFSEFMRDAERYAQPEVRVAVRKVK